VAMLRKYLMGPFEVSGSNEVSTIRCLIINDSKYIVKGGPSSRRVIDFSILKIAGVYLQATNPLSTIMTTGRNIQCREF
jgi:penicillin amidase